MEISEQTFRRAVVGGFHREDVLKYIESSALIATERIETLEKECAELKAAEKEVDSVARKLEIDSRSATRAAMERATSLEEETARLDVALSEKSKLLYETKEALEAQRIETQCLRAELDHLREKTNEMERGATAYAELRDRTGTIELEAHQRAMLIEQAAERKAAEIRSSAETEAIQLRTDAERLTATLQTEYARLRKELDASVATVSRDLGQIGRMLDSLGRGFSNNDTAIQKLQERCKHVPLRNQPLQPLPLVDEK